MTKVFPLLVFNILVSAWFFGCFAAVGYPWGYLPGILGSTLYLVWQDDPDE